MLPLATTSLAESQLQALAAAAVQCQVFSAPRQRVSVSRNQSLEPLLARRIQRGSLDRCRWRAALQQTDGGGVP